MTSGVRGALLALCLAHCVSLWACGAEDGGPAERPAPRPAASSQVLLDVPFPGTPEPGWSLSSDALVYIGQDWVTGVLFPGGGSGATVHVPVDERLAGARRAAVRVMSDGAFEMRIRSGATVSETVRGANTKRRSIQVEVPFPEPLEPPAPDEAGGATVAVEVAANELPVLIERVRFLK